MYKYNYSNINKILKSSRELKKIKIIDSFGIVDCETQ